MKENEKENDKLVSVSWLKKKIEEKLITEPNSAGEWGFRSACNYVLSLLN